MISLDLHDYLTELNSLLDRIARLGGINAPSQPWRTSAFGGGAAAAFVLKAAQTDMARIKRQQRPGGPLLRQLRLQLRQLPHR